jgi:hypothetical protein
VVASMPQCSQSTKPAMNAAVMASRAHKPTDPQRYPATSAPLDKSTDLPAVLRPQSSPMLAPVTANHRKRRRLRGCSAPEVRAAFPAGGAGGGSPTGRSSSDWRQAGQKTSPTEGREAPQWGHCPSDIRVSSYAEQKNLTCRGRCLAQCHEAEKAAAVRCNASFGAPPPVHDAPISSTVAVRGNGLKVAPTALAVLQTHIQDRHRPR